MFYGVRAMKVLFVGVFDWNRRSTNTSQLLSFKRAGVNVSGYDYRQKASLMGELKRDEHMRKTVREGNYDLVVYSKCNQVSYKTFADNSMHAKTCLWFMDPIGTYNTEMRKKTALVDYFCCDKENVLEEALKINPNSFHVCEGFDSDVDKPQDVAKEYDVSFIGNIYGDRRKWINEIEKPVKIISSAYGKQHAIEVCKSRINLNFCTDSGASDRVYKILAAGGFLLTNEWKNRKKHLTDGKECVIFSNYQDLNNKIEYYLNNFDEAQEIAANGLLASQKWNRVEWAKKIVELYEKTNENAYSRTVDW